MRRLETERLGQFPHLNHSTFTGCLVSCAFAGSAATADAADNNRPRARCSRSRPAHPSAAAKIVESRELQTSPALHRPADIPASVRGLPAPRALRRLWD